MTALLEASSAYFSTAKRRLAVSFLLAIAFGGGYAAISLLNQYRFGLLSTPSFHGIHLDTFIPFNPGWVWVYMTYYPFCFLPLFLPDVRNTPSIFLRTALAFAIQFGVSFLFFLFLPLHMTHASLTPGTSASIVGMLYRMDLGFNSFPSLHVANITFVSLLYKRLQGGRIAILVALLAALITISTLLVKQHFLSDVVAGFLLGWGSYAVAFSSRRQTE